MFEERLLHGSPPFAFDCQNGVTPCWCLPVAPFLAMWSKWLPFCCCFDFYRKRLHMVAQFFVNCSMLHPPQAFCCCSYHHFRIKNSRWDLILSYHHPNQQVDVTQRHGTTHHITSLPNVFLNDPDWSGRTARVRSTRETLVKLRRKRKVSVERLRSPDAQRRATRVKWPQMAF